MLYVTYITDKLIATTHKISMVWKEINLISIVTHKHADM